MIADDAALFTSVEDFGEVITFRRKLTADTTHYTGDDEELTGDLITLDAPIDAVVIRDEITVVSEDGDTVLPIWEVHVANNALLGISSTELNLGGDTLSFPPRDGMPAETKTVIRLTSQDHGMLVLQCR